MQVEAAYRLLEDGQWHTWTELRKVMLAAIPAAPAKRFAIKLQERDRNYRGVTNPKEINNEDLIYRGRNHLVVGSLANLVKVIDIDRRGSTDRVNWVVKLKNKDERYRPRKRNFQDEDWKTQNAEVMKTGRERGGLVRRQRWRERLDRMSDEEALNNTTDPQRGALMTRPHLWPADPAPVSSMIYMGGSAYRAGWLTREVKGTREIFTINIVWPEPDKLVFGPDDLSQIIIYHHWRIYLPKG